METGLRDWVAAASGRVYSVATIEAAQALDARRRREVRRGVGRGELPADRDGLRYGTALARDLDRMRPRPERPRLLWIQGASYLGLVLINVLSSAWGAVVFFAVVGGMVTTWQVLEVRRRVHWRPVILAGYDRLSHEDRVHFDRAVREPARVSAKHLMLGHVVAVPGIFLAGLAAALAVDDGFDGGWSELVSLAAFFVAVMGSITVVGSVWARRRFTRETLGEPRPMPEPSASA